jgi:sugar phosphate isomerase/epimerase
MKLSISLPAIYSVYKISLEDAYRALYGCGFRNTCIIEAIDKKKSGLKDHYDAAIRADLKPLTVRIECNPFDSEDAFSFVKQTVKRVGEYGINTAIIPTGTIKNIGHYDYLARNEMYLNSILAIAEKKETQLLFENSGSYQIAHYLHHARTIHLLTDRISHPLLGVNVNVGNLGLAEAQPYPQIR